MMLEMTKQDMEAGFTKDWGVFIGQTNGFTISEGTEEEMHAMALKYVPFVRFEIYPLASRDQFVRIPEAIQKSTQSAGITRHGLGKNQNFC